MSDTSTPYHDVLLWASQHGGDPDVGTTAFIYKRARELIVVIPKEGSYKILRYVGKKVGPQVLRFSI